MSTTEPIELVLELLGAVRTIDVIPRCSNTRLRSRKVVLAPTAIPVNGRFNSQIAVVSITSSRPLRTRRLAELFRSKWTEDMNGPIIAFDVGYLNE